MLKGIDCSLWQGPVDWSAAIADGVQFAIIKATQGLKGVDQQLARNLSVLRMRGIPHGMYHYCQSESNQAADEADHFLNAIGPLQAGEFLVLDFELSTNVHVVQWCKNFLDRVYEKTGVKAFLYINLSTLQAHDWSPVASYGYRLFLARYDNQPLIQPDETSAAKKWQFPQVSMKQYSENGKINGIVGSADQDLFDGTKEELLGQGYKPK